jgi:hypothetical protein
MEAYVNVKRHFLEEAKFCSHFGGTIFFLLMVGVVQEAKLENNSPDLY